MVTWTDNSGTATGTDTHLWTQVFNSVYQPTASNITGGTSVYNSIMNSVWTEETGGTTSRDIYVWPRIVSDPSLPTNTVIVAPNAAGTDATFTTHKYLVTSPWATNVEVTPSNTWATINSDDVYDTVGAVTQAYHYILRFTQGAWKWEDALPGQKKATYRSKLKGQMYPYEKHRNEGSGNFGNVAENEIVALQLLKSMLTPERWKKYLKYGFVDVQAKSGLVYQVIRGSTHVRVFRQGEKIAELCVSLKNRYEIPPTDEVITRMIIAECDEPDLWQRANVHGPFYKMNLPKPKTEEDLARIVLQKAA